MLVFCPPSHGYSPEYGRLRKVRKIHCYRTPSPSLFACALALLAGCGGAAFAAGPTEQARCALLTKAEIQEAIGPHDGGKTDLANEWGLQSCRWTTTSSKKGSPDGWFDAIEVALFDPARTSWARQQAKGAGFVKGAVYDTSYGELWFDCAGSRFCVVKVRTASGVGREETAKRLAHLVESRLR